MDDALDPYTAARIRQHLLDCESCAREIELHASIARSARVALSVSASSGLEERILSQYQPVPVRISWAGRAARFVRSPGNVVFLLFLTAFVVFTGVAMVHSLSKPVSGSLNIPTRETVSVLETCGETITGFLHPLIAPLRLHSNYTAASTIMLVLPILLLLFLLDRYVLRFLQRSRL